MSQPLVSVVIKTYRRPEWLQLTLNSVLRQSHSNLEVLVFDNAADDATADVIAGLRDQRIRYTQREVNIGLFANAMDGLDRASGEYILDFQDDDLLDPLFVEALVRGLEDRPDATLAFSDYHLIDSGGNLLPARHRWLRRHEGRKGLRTGYYQPFTGLAAMGAIFLSSALLRRGVIDWASTPPQVGTSYDSWAVLRAAENSACAYHDARPLSLMRTHPGSDSHANRIALAKGGIYALEEALARGRHEDERPILKRLAKRYSNLSRQYLILGDKTEARQSADRAWEISSSVDALATVAATRFPAHVITPLARGLRTPYLKYIQHEQV